MANTTRKKKNTTSRSMVGRSTRGRRRNSGSSAGTRAFFSLLFVALCGAGVYFYKNGVPISLDRFKSDRQELTVPGTRVETGTETPQPEQKKVHPEKKTPSREQPAVQKQQRRKVAPKQNPQPEEVDKFVKTTYNSYHQGRWGYTVVYPSFLTQQIQSENNDGCHFADYHGTEFITYGSWNVTEASIRELYRRKLDDNMKVTYKRLYKEENYFVKFGYTKDGRMFYLKKVIANRLEGAPVITGILFFPPEYKKGSEEVIRKMFSKFPY